MSRYYQENIDSGKDHNIGGIFSNISAGTAVMEEILELELCSHVAPSQSKWLKPENGPDLPFWQGCRFTFCYKRVFHMSLIH